MSKSFFLPVFFFNSLPKAFFFFFRDLFFFVMKASFFFSLIDFSPSYLSFLLFLFLSHFFPPLSLFSLKTTFLRNVVSPTFLWNVIIIIIIIIIIFLQWWALWALRLTGSIKWARYQTLHWWIHSYWTFIIGLLF